ncbi:MAG: histidine phosphatase family protein [Pseudomonadota bacterium]
MELILWRHADAENTIPDEDRRLTAKGHRQAERMAIWLRERLPQDAHALSSPARRAQQTAQALTPKFRISSALSTTATPQSVLKAASWPGGGGTLVLVGHQPALGAAAALALTGTATAWSFKKGAIWWLAYREPGDEVIVRAVMAPDML